MRLEPAHCTMMCWYRFFREVGIENVVLLSADGALEAAPAMGAADIILDLVSTGVTLRENNLKQINGGDILEVCVVHGQPTHARTKACPSGHVVLISQTSHQHART
jgi:ATP phosphoribosyltransferase